MSSIQSVPGPARVAAGLEADAPRLGVTGRGGGRGGLELVPGRRGSALPDAGVVPDQALDGALGEDAGELAVRGLAEGREARAAWRPRRPRSRRSRAAGATPSAYHCCIRPGPGQAGHVGQVAAGDGGRQRAGQVALPGVVHGHAGALEPRRHHRVEVVLLGAGPRRVDADLAADVLAGEAAGRAGALAPGSALAAGRALAPVDAAGLPLPVPDEQAAATIATTASRPANLAPPDVRSSMSILLSRIIGPVVRAVPWVTSSAGSGRAGR